MFKSFNARALGLNLSASQTIALAAEAGFDGVDLLLRDVVEAGDDVATLAEMLADLGLRPGAFPLPIEWRGSREAFERGLERLPAYALVARALGYARTGTWVLPALPGPFDSEAERRSSREASIAWHVDRLGAIARVLEAHDIRLGLEVIGVETSRPPGSDPFARRLADLDLLFGTIWRKPPNLGLLVDAFHLHAAGESAESGLAWGVDKVVWVHVADLPADFTGDRAAIFDEDRGLPGEHGAVDAPRLLRLLQATGIGYDGPVTAEPMTGCRSLRNLTPIEIARRTRASLDLIWPTR